MSLAYREASNQSKRARSMIENMTAKLLRKAVEGGFAYAIGFAKEGAALLQEAEEAAGRENEDASNDEDAVEDPTTTTTITAGIPAPPIPTEGVMKRLDVTVGYTKCPTTSPG